MEDGRLAEGGVGVTATAHHAYSAALASLLACGGGSPSAGTCPRLARAPLAGAALPEGADVATDDGAAAAFAEIRGRALDAACVHRSRHVTGLVVVGSRADGVCRPSGVFFDRAFAGDPEAAAGPVLRELGLGDAPRHRREELAFLWVQEVLLAGATLLPSPIAPEHFGGDQPEFEPPSMETNDRGEIVVRGWHARGGAPPSYDHLSIRFAASGELMGVENLQCFEAP